MAVDRKIPAGRIIEASLTYSRDDSTMQAVAELGWSIEGLSASITDSEATPHERAHMARYSVVNGINAIARLVGLRHPKT